MIENAIKFVKPIFADDCSGHDYHHTIRVYRLAVQIATWILGNVTRIPRH